MGIEKFNFSENCRSAETTMKKAAMQKLIKKAASNGIDLKQALKAAISNCPLRVRCNSSLVVRSICKNSQFHFHKVAISLRYLGHFCALTENISSNV